MIKLKLLVLLACVNLSVFAQQRTYLNLNEALHLVDTNSTELQLAKIKAQTKQNEYQQAKEHQYPDVQLSGQYYRLTTPDTDLKLKLPLPKTNIDVNSFSMAQANVFLPVFAGGKIKNAVQAAEHLYKAENAKYLTTKEELYLKTIEYYAQLYRSLKAVQLINDNIKASKERVKDFNNLEKNGIIARNDLLKAQLQLAKMELSLEEANKNVQVVNYALVTILHLPNNFLIDIDENQFQNQSPIKEIPTLDSALQNRTELEMIHFYKKANQNQLKIAQSAYYPQIGLSAGYIALNLQNFLSVTNALNVGGGITYNLSSLYKTQKEVKIAKNKLEELNTTETLLKQNIEIQNQQAIENFKLAQKQKLVYETAIQQAAENYRIVNDKHQNGLATTTELIDADIEQLNAKINLANAKANVLLKYYETLATAGTLGSSFNTIK